MGTHAAPMVMPLPGTFGQAQMRGFPMQRFRTAPGPHLMLGRRTSLLPVPFPGFAPLDPAACPTVCPSACPAFSQQELDMVLYGYAKRKTCDQPSGHALSGLRIGQLTYGMDRILAGCSNGKHPSTTVPIDPSGLAIPDGLQLFQTILAGTLHSGMFSCETLIAKGTRFGPFRGKQVNTSEIKSNDDNTYMWEVFQHGKLSHFVDGRGNSGNWMAFVNCARYAQEQNLIAVQAGEAIYYETCKDVPRHTELLVWYGDCYLQFMGIPVSLKDVDPHHTQEVPDDEGYRCDRCGKVFAYRYYRDKHLKYTRCVDQGDRKFPCHLCNRSFEKRDRLRIHILHVHEKHRPHKCSVCSKCFSQSSSLNKHMRVHSGERPYKCVYCNKAFTASSILRTHIRQHSGEKPFKCKHCGKAFASHAAHDSHVRRTHTKEAPVHCPVCGLQFAQLYDLKYHMKIHEVVEPRGDQMTGLTEFVAGNVNGIDMTRKLTTQLTANLTSRHVEAVGVDQPGYRRYLI